MDDMSTSKTSTRKAYGKDTSDLRAGDVVRWDLVTNSIGLMNYVEQHGDRPMVVREIRGGRVIVDWLDDGKSVRDNYSFTGGFFHYRFVRDEFLTAAKRAIEDAKAKPAKV